MSGALPLRALTPAVKPFAAPDPSELTSLASLVHDCARSGVGRQVLLVRLDTLPPTLARSQQRRLARTALEGLTRVDRALLHDLPNGAVAVSWKGGAGAALDEAMAALLHAFETGRRAAPLSQLISVFDLPQDGALLLSATGLPGESDGPRVSAIREPLETLRSAGLDGLERLLTSANLARFMRRRTICRQSEHGWDLAWEKRYLSMPEIAETLAPAHDITADAWLFRRLTRVLDRRMLALLGAPRELDGVPPFSLDLNVASILAPAFLRFDAALPVRLRNRVVLEVTLSDIIADPAAFSFARDFAHGRGYGVLLRGVTAGVLPLLGLGSLELDYVELVWSADLPPVFAGQAVGGDGRLPEWVLGDADTPAALAWAAEQKMSLVHGKDVAPTGTPVE